jgi:hypothetical protein
MYPEQYSLLDSILHHYRSILLSVLALDGVEEGTRLPSLRSRPELSLSKKDI